MAFELFILIICLASVLVVNGCGPLQADQEKVVNFTVSNFNLPAVMAYSEDGPAKMKVPSISTTRNGAESFVRMLIMQSVIDVLYEQGRSAFLPDNVISSILQQLSIQMTYEPLNCIKVIDLTGGNPNAAPNNMINCIIVDETVTGTCSGALAAACQNAMTAMNVKTIDKKFLSISGSLQTTNAVMANWTNQMWERVMSRVLRRITSSPSGSYFNGASVSVR